jgi:hypothetical protein
LLGHSSSKPSPSIAGAPSASTVGRLDLEHVGDAIRKRLERRHVRGAVHGLALLLRIEQRHELLVHAPLVVECRRRVREVHRPLHPLDRHREDAVAVRLDLRQRHEHPVVERLGQRPGHEQRGHVSLLHPGDRERLARLVPLHVEDAVVVDRHERHMLLACHLGVSRRAHQVLPVGVARAPALGDDDVVVPACLQATDHAAHELRIRRAPGRAVVAAGLRGILEPVEAADVRLEQDGRRRRLPRDHGVAQPHPEVERRMRIVTLQDHDRRSVRRETRSVPRAQRRAVHGAARRDGRPRILR